MSFPSATCPSYAVLTLQGLRPGRQIFQVPVPKLSLSVLQPASKYKLAREERDVFDGEQLSKGTRHCKENSKVS